MMDWEYDEHGILRSPNGDWLEYGSFGADTYGLHALLDNDHAVFCLSTEYGEPAPVGKANMVLNKLRSGWRPVNWAEVPQA